MLEYKIEILNTMKLDYLGIPIALILGICIGFYIAAKRTEGFQTTANTEVPNTFSGKVACSTIDRLSANFKNNMENMIKLHSADQNAVASFKKMITDNAELVAKQKAKLNCS